MFRRTGRRYDEAALYDYAVGALARRMRTVAELKRLLRQRMAHHEGESSEAIIDAVIVRLKDQKYLNDSQYAATYSSYRQNNEKFGPMRVVTDLKAKGVHGDVIEKAVSAAYSGVKEEKLAREYLARKRMRKPANQKETARIFRALARAGFGSRVIFAILKKWDVDEETISLLSTELP